MWEGANLHTETSDEAPTVGQGKGREQFTWSLEMKIPVWLDARLLSAWHPWEELVYLCFPSLWTFLMVTWSSPLGWKEVLGKLGTLGMSCFVLTVSTSTHTPLLQLPGDSQRILSWCVGWKHRLCSQEERPTLTCCSWPTLPSLSLSFPVLTPGGDNTCLICPFWGHAQACLMRGMAGTWGTLSQWWLLTLVHNSLAAILKVQIFWKPKFGFNNWPDLNSFGSKSWPGLTRGYS